jgi:FkbM family methyltransferase
VLGANTEETEPMHSLSIPGSSVARIPEELLCLTGLFRPVRNNYQRLLKPQRYERRTRWQEFFGQFVAAGDLVFDVGANQGDIAGEFLELGARVVAIEPLPKLARKIHSRYRCTALSVEDVAVGAEPHEADLHVGRAHFLSSLSSERVGGRPELWVDEVRVAVVTLNSLIERHGLPQFVKIDVEGYEREVIEGLSAPVKALSFEFGIMDSEGVRACVEHLAEVGSYEFNFCAGYEYAFASGEWLRGPELVRAVDELTRTRRGTGDIYARRLGG